MITVAYSIGPRYERRATFTPDEILPFIGATYTFEGHEYDLGAARLRLFATSLTCVRCGIVGSFFALERNATKKVYKTGLKGKGAPQHRYEWVPNPEQEWHFNLYAVKDDKDILMTKDHIVPVALGGPDKDWNYQTMCMPCNSKKGKKLDFPVELPEKLANLIS